MSKDVITVHGEDVVVREDTAKAYRGVNWAWVSLGAILIIAAILLFLFLFSSAPGVPGPPQPVKPVTQ